MKHEDRIIFLSGITTVLSSILFPLIFVALGFIQPGYNHFIDTISVLALGRWGFLQTINFFVLAIGMGAIGLGLSVILKRKTTSSISIIFFIIAMAIMLLAFLPADSVDRTRIQLTKSNSLHGTLHLGITMLLVLLTIPVVKNIVNDMKKNKFLRHLSDYTLISFLINAVFGSLWFAFRRMGILFEWKGLWQKMLAMNVLIWMFVVGLQFLATINLRGSQRPTSP